MLEVDDAGVLLDEEQGWELVDDRAPATEELEELAPEETAAWGTRP